MKLIFEFLAMTPLRPQRRMGTIDKHLFENAGARGCSNSDYNLVVTTCCHSHLVEDDELNDLYFDPTDITKVIGGTDVAQCPLCSAQDWDYKTLPEWPRDRTGWQWAYHQDHMLVEEWIKEGST